MPVSVPSPADLIHKRPPETQTVRANPLRTDGLCFVKQFSTPLWKAYAFFAWGTENRLTE